MTVSLIETSNDVFSPLSNAADRVVFGESDRRVINGLAAYLLRYDKPSEAFALLSINRRHNPADEQTLRLLVQAFVQLEDWERAEAMMEQLDRLSRRREPTARHLLMKSVILLRRLRIAQGRSIFRKFLHTVTGDSRHDGIDVNAD